MAASHKFRPLKEDRSLKIAAECALAILHSARSERFHTRRRRGKMSETIESKNKALVLEAFDTLFNKRDYAAAERYWSPNYIQHSAHIEPGRDGLFNLIKSIPPTLKYEPGTIVAEKDFVIVHGRFSGFGLPVNWIAADIVRIKDGILVEHWDVIEDEAPRESSKSGLPMFGEKFVG
jgi:predicted SnoaL-like aldol condensation-catalyzing enzyme